mmetsp:Transcript_34511/g.75322  ORF Transcript_34511/g.75322 Transcript_34511/m.75322 type:complete len:492 (-) Transcript_34511:99-1574(-)
MDHPTDGGRAAVIEEVTSAPRSRSPRRKAVKSASPARGAPQAAPARRVAVVSDSPPRGASSSSLWFHTVKRDWKQLANAPEELRQNPGLVGEAMRHSSGAALSHAAEELRADEEFVLGAAQELGAAVLKYASTKLASDRDFVLKVVDFCSPLEALEHIDLDLRTELLADEDFVLEALREGGADVLESASTKLRENRVFMLRAAALCPPGEVFQYASDGLIKELYADRDWVLEAVGEVGAEVLEHASPELLNDKNFILAALKCCPPGEVLEYAAPELRATFYADRDFVLQAVKDAGVQVLEDADAKLRADREFLLEAAKATSLEAVLPYAPEELRQQLAPSQTAEPAAEAAGEEVAKAAAKTGASVREAAGPAVSAEERAAALKAVKDGGAKALGLIPSALRRDREFLLEAAAGCPVASVLWHASDESRAVLCSDKNFALRAAKEVGAASLAHASAALRADLGFMLLVVACCPAAEALPYFSEELRAELDAD